MIARLDFAEMSERCDEADRSVAAHSEVTDIVEKNDACGARRIFGFNEHRSDDDVGPSRFVHDSRSELVELAPKEFASGSDRTTAKIGSAAHHDAGGLAASVGVDDG